MLIFFGVGGIEQQQETAQQFPYRIVGTMSQLMVDIIYPTSNDIFYIVRKPPSKDLPFVNKIKD